MFKLVGDIVSSTEEFMAKYRVSFYGSRRDESDKGLDKMDHPAALHRLQVGVPATVEHSTEAGPETGKWVAETTQVGGTYCIFLPSRFESLSAEFYYFHGCPQTAITGQGSITPDIARFGNWVCTV